MVRSSNLVANVDGHLLCASLPDGLMTANKSKSTSDIMKKEPMPLLL